MRRDEGLLDMKVRGYRDLTVWQKAMDLVVESYRLVRLLPPSESFGLISQIRRAVVSIPANIAEGQGRDHLGDYIHHLSVAKGSLVELETHFLICERLKFLKPSDVQLLLSSTDEIGRMLSGLSKKLQDIQT